MLRMLTLFNYAIMVLQLSLCLLYFYDIMVLMFAMHYILF